MTTFGSCQIVEIFMFLQNLKGGTTPKQDFVAQPEIWQIILIFLIL
jgi:hypothetical protein